jgi:FlaA1/EpsC-like NDP-sugar epimerase
MALFKNDVFLTLYNRSPLRKGWVQAIGDTLFAGFAYTVCYGLVRGFRFVAADAENFIPKALVVASVQIMICWFSGFYRGEGRLYGPGTFFRVFRTVTFATVTSELILLYLGRRFDFLDFFALLLDYFALFSFFLVTGLTYRALAHLSRGGHGLRTMIIYGAGNFGRAYLDALVASNDRGLIPIGFIDDNGTAGGSSIQGYPVHGSMSDILPLLRRMQVDEIHIAMAHPSPDAVLRLKQATRGYPVLLKQVAFAHERFSTEEIEEHTTDNS